MRVAPLIALIALPCSLAAQLEPMKQPTSVPLELASALASAGGFGSGSDPHILVESAPEWLLPQLYLPKDARIVGSAFYNALTVVVLSLPASHASIAAELDREMKTKGWKDTPTLQYQTGGFRPSYGNSSTPTPYSNGYQLCGQDKSYMRGWVTHTDALSQIVVIQVTKPSGVGYSVCNPPQRQGYEGPRFTMPTLYDPTGATAPPQLMMSCEPQMGGYSGTGSQTTLKTSMTPDAILDHYAKQLKDSGWALQPNVPSTIGRSWTKKDSTGTTQWMALNITTHPTDQNCRKVELQLRWPSR